MNSVRNNGKFPKKKFLFYSYDALHQDVAWRVLMEGHDVKLYIKDPDCKEIADGFVPKTDDWEKEVNWADVIVFDDVLGQGAMAQKLRQQGKLVIGGTPYTDRLEDDRGFGQEELKKAGVTIIPCWEFKFFDDAIEFVRKHPGKYVIKPSGEAQNIKRLLFVGNDEDGKDVLQVLKSYRKTWQEEVKEFQLQKTISGVEVAVTGFFNGKEFIYPINVNFEHKKLFPGNIGPSTGEMGTSMFWSGPNKIFNATLKKMEPQLRREGYIGAIDVNCIVNNNGIYPLEFTVRFGYPTIQIQMEGMLTPTGEFLYRLANGESFTIKTKSGFQIGARLVVPPFPFRDQKTYESLAKNAVVMFKKFPKNWDGIHIEDVKMVKGEWVVAGSSGIVVIIVGTGQTMKQAQAQMYHRINNILIPHMYYRDDIGDRWYEDSDKLHNWGYLREL